jgi:carbonic anhydrase/acetyltransferase-like protein (isoleucine patch superfamily)
MGAIVLDGAVLGKGCLVGAGALVTGGMNAPDGSLILGSPATVRGPVTPEQAAAIRRGVQSYLTRKEWYR